MKHRHRTDEQDEVDDQCDIRDETGNFVVNSHANQRDCQPNQAGQNACLNRVQSKSRRYATLFLDAYRRLQRVLKHAR